MPLVTYDEQADFLDIPAGTDKELIEDLLAQTTALFERETGRSNAPFSAAITGRTEIHEGSAGSSVLTLDYPIASVTSIGVGRDVSLPDEVLLPTDPSLVVWRVGERDLIRTDGGVWRRFRQRWVKVVYNTQEYYPADVKLAVKRMVATIYQHRGKEGYTALTRGSRSWSMGGGSGMSDVFWEGAVANHRKAWVR
jgi:hypothetical protein